MEVERGPPAASGERYGGVKIGGQSRDRASLTRGVSRKGGKRLSPSQPHATNSSEKTGGVWEEGKSTAYQSPREGKAGRRKRSHGGKLLIFFPGDNFLVPVQLRTQFIVSSEGPGEGPEGGVRPRIRTTYVELKRHLASNISGWETSPNRRVRITSRKIPPEKPVDLTPELTEERSSWRWIVKKREGGHDKRKITGLGGGATALDRPPVGSGPSACL